jgi:hypothetical protein
LEDPVSQSFRTWSQGDPPAGDDARPSQVNSDVVARAEAALKALSGQFAQWLQDEVDKLDGAYRRVCAEGLGGEAGETLYTHSHDLKGLGSTYEFPIVTRLAGSLCRLMDARRADAPPELIEAHVSAIKSVVRNDVRDETPPVGAALVQALESRVREVAP